MWIHPAGWNILQQKGLGAAETRIADLNKGKLVDLTTPIAISAAILSDQLKLPVADSLILAMARDQEAVLWTQDEHFKGIEGVEYVPARSLR